MSSADGGEGRNPGQSGIVSPFVHVWSRHVLDSIQLLSHIESSAKRLLDFGSGAGFPGVVLGIAGAERGLGVWLVESNARKAAFLRTVVRELSPGIQVLHGRMETVQWGRQAPPEYVTARAVAELAKLLEWSEWALKLGATCLFPKGRTVERELESVRRRENYQWDLLPSDTDREGRIVRVRLRPGVGS
ncbi:MAG: 16S rRNA (guanine(527)-N(7))-methyltransferase RsmG [Methylobacteriaceae bacterium]|nr:16S rRNA (guanine(527)-N(7))-methyltransferase RsmG [Methylobacteriaceae bacterium]